MKFTDRRRLVEKGLQACDVRPRALVLLSVLGVLAALFRVVSMSLFLPLVYAAFSDASSPRGRFSALFKILPLEEFNLTYVMSGAILFAGIMAAMLAYLTDYLESRLTYHGQTMLSRKVFKRFLSYGQAYSDRTGPNVQLRELRRVPGKVSRQVKIFSRHLGAALEVLVYSVALLFLAWQAALVCFVVLVSYYLVFGRFVGWVDSFSREEDQEEDLSEDRAADVLLNLPLVRGAGTTGEERRQWRKFQQQRFKLRKRASIFSAGIKPARQLLTLLVMLLFVLVISIGLGELEVYDVARLVIFFLILKRLMAAFAKVLEAPADWFAYTEVLDRYFLLMDREDKGIVRSGSDILEPLRAPVEISNLDFSYGDTPALRGLNVSFPLHECTAVVGLSGSGKSTLLKLLTRQYEIDAGQIRLNDRDIGDYSWEGLANEIVHLGSEPKFFNKSIEYNLSYGLEEVTPEEIFSALERSSSTDFMSSLESGLQTVMGLQEQPFSRGQLQRLGIARLLIQRQASLFLLDEATSALDEVTEKSILRQMVSRPNTTILFVTHRTTAIDPEMHVVVFDQGQVVEEGTRKELESRPDSYFSRLCHTDLAVGSSGS
jgi:ABC-type multidrug transport system fused ATPase/permease subunit